MEKLLEVDVETLQSGVFPDLDEVVSPFWRDARNVIPHDAGLQPYPGCKAILNIDLPEVTCIAQAHVGVERRLYFTSFTYAWVLKLTDSQMEAEVFSVPFENIFFNCLDHSVHNIEIWGSWAIINSGHGRPVVWRNDGQHFDANDRLPTPFKWAKVLKRFGPTLIAMNTAERKIGDLTEGGHNWIEWCHDDDVFQWEPTAENTAGNLTLRDLDGPINCACPIGDNLAIYSNETMGLLSRVGAGFVFGAKEVLRGIGAWGPRAVCEFNGKNYGFGPQGLFMTDGVGFEHIEHNKVEHWIEDRIDKVRAKDWAYCWNNLDLHLFEFRFPDKYFNWYGVLYDPATRQFWPTDLPLHYAIPHASFSYPIGAIRSGIFRLNKGSRWINNSQMSGYLQSKPLGGVERGRAKQVDMVEILGERGELNFEATALFGGPDAPGELMLSAPAVRENWLNFESDYASFRLSWDSTDDPFQISALPVWGQLTGRRA